MIRAAHSCKCENNNLRPGYLRSAVVVFTGITWPAAACHLLLFHFRREHHVHLLAVEPGHRLHFGELFEIGGKAQQQDFALLLEDDRTAAEEDVSLDFGPLLEEVLRVLEFEIVVVVVGLGPEAPSVPWLSSFAGKGISGNRRCGIRGARPSERSRSGRVPVRRRV